MVTGTVKAGHWLTGAKAIVVLCCVAASIPAFGAGLGDIEVRSKLYEPFHAQIALRGVREGDLDSLRVRLADEAVFERVGLERVFLLTKLKFEVVSTGARRGYVKVTSHDRVREPSMSFVVEAELAGEGGTLQRRYDVVLDLQ